MPTTASASGSEIASLISQIELTTSNIPQDEELRQKLYDATRKLNLALESPGDTIQRLVHLSSQPTCARLAYQLGIFNLLVRHGDQGMTVHELLEQTEADDMLLRRVMRYLASMGMVTEIAVDTYASSNITKTLVRPAVQSSLSFSFEIAMPCYQQLVAFLATTGYRNPSDTANSAFQLAFDTKKLPFDWLMEHSDFLKNFSLWMTVQHEGNKVWLDELPFEKEFCQNVEPETPLFVDIGGNIGHQCLLLKTTYPEITGRVILQDLAPALQHALPIEGVEKMAHDFWTKQPIKGARAYYMRNILHDYSDEKCVEILRQIMPAMSEDSAILIDEMVIPVTGAHWHATSLDFLMMATLASLERTEDHWRRLLDSAGLKIVKVYTYNAKTGDSITVARRKDAFP